MSSFAAKRRTTRKLGELGESHAAAFLEKRGLHVIERNYRCKAGELDIIAADSKQIVFAEVKTRRLKDENSRAFMNLSARQRLRNHRAALSFLRAMEITGVEARFDLIEIFFRGRKLQDIIHTRDYLPPRFIPEPEELTSTPVTNNRISLNTLLHLFPCPGCGRAFAVSPNAFCPECLAKLPRLDNSITICPGCGGELDSALAVCSQCLAEPQRLWHKATALMEYRAYGRKLIHHYKFHNASALARPFAVLLAEKLKEDNITADFIIPIPLHSIRLRQRGYNQAALLGGLLSKSTGITLLHALTRTDRRTAQSKRNRSDRHKALKNSFSLVIPPEILDGKRILLLDDILTTGATLNSAASAILKHAHPAEIHTVVIARTPAHSGVFGRFSGSTVS